MTSKEEQALGSTLHEKLVSIRKSIADIDSTADWDAMKDKIARIQAGFAVRGTIGTSSRVFIFKIG